MEYSPLASEFDDKLHVIAPGHDGRLWQGAGTP